MLRDVLVLHIRDEPIPAPRHRHDEAMLSALRAQRAAQCRDRLRQRVFLDDAPGPDRTQQFVARDHVVAVLDQEDECVEGLRRQRHGRAVALAQFPGPGVEAVRREAVAPGGRGRHGFT
jgi:hypothetical protein